MLIIFFYFYKINIELDFIIEVKKEEKEVVLSSEHIEYKWVDKKSNLLDDFIKAKLTNI